jgi:hypothetical protein
VWLKTQHPDDERPRVSHETIYRSLLIQARGVLKRAALLWCPSIVLPRLVWAGPDRR